MKNQDFKIGYNIVLLLVVGTIMLTGIGAIVKILHWPFSQIFLAAGLMLLFATWIIIISDMVKSKIYNKAFWIIIMLIMPLIASVFYLIQRNRLIRLGEKFNSKK